MDRLNLTPSCHSDFTFQNNNEVAAFNYFGAQPPSDAVDDPDQQLRVKRFSKKYRPSLSESGTQKLQPANPRIKKSQSTNWFTQGPGMNQVSSKSSLVKTNEANRESVQVTTSKSNVCAKQPEPVGQAPPKVYQLPKLHNKENVQYHHWQSQITSIKPRKYAKIIRGELVDSAVCRPKKQPFRELSPSNVRRQRSPRGSLVKKESPRRYESPRRERAYRQPHNYESVYRLARACSPRSQRTSRSPQAVRNQSPRVSFRRKSLLKNEQTRVSNIVHPRKRVLLPEFYSANRFRFHERERSREALKQVLLLPFVRIGHAKPLLSQYFAESARKRSPLRRLSSSRKLYLTRSCRSLDPVQQRRRRLSQW